MIRKIIRLYLITAMNSHHRTILIINRHNHKIMINRMIYIKTIHRHNRQDQILTAVMNHRINLTKIHSHRQTTVICHMSRTAEIISHLILMNRQVRINQMILEEVRTIFHLNRMPEMFFYRHRVSHMETVKIQCYILTENNLKCRNKKFLHFFIKNFHITPKISI